MNENGSVKRDLFISVNSDYIPVFGAVRENGFLTEYIDYTKDNQPTGSFYAARVTEYVKSYRGCFADIGQELRGFLAGEENLRAGDWVLCSSQSEARGSKGIRLSSNVKLAGRFLILMPKVSGIFVSDKISDPSVRNRLVQIMSNYINHHDVRFGIIIRTDAASVSDVDIYTDYDFLVSRYQKLVSLFNSAVSDSNPSLIFRLPIIEKLIRLFPISSVNSVYTDNSVFSHNLSQNYPELTSKIVHGDNKPAFSEIGRDIVKLTGRKVWLPSGGYLVFDTTEAMTVIDVNSGKTSGIRNPEEMALKVNLEAGREIMRQLRLRNIGGIILCDMIDMNSEENREKLLSFMRKIALNDPVEIEIPDITRLGIVEIARKRT